MAVKLFVGGLSFSTSTDRLREAFAACGNVESASVVTDRDTGRSRGFGFVEMATNEEAESAISKLNGTSLDGRTIQVEKAKAPGAGGGGRPGGGGRGGFGGGRPGGGGGGGGGGRGGRW
jgi:RNA recognition motif-containing protein